MFRRLIDKSLFCAEDNKNTSQSDLKKWSISYVNKQANRTAVDPNSKVKLLGMVFILQIMCYNIPRADAKGLMCQSCVTWAAAVCTGLIAFGEKCASVRDFPPEHCLLLLGTGGLGCVTTVGVCAAVCSIV